MFIGDSEIDQIFKIFQVQGTPSETYWPEALKYPDFKSAFPKWKGKPMANHVKNMDEAAVDLLAQMVALEPNQRISCRMALEHPYFEDLDKSKFT